MRPAFYRVGQFVHHLRRAPISPADRDIIESVLTPPSLVALFCRMSPGEQAHSLRVMKTVAAAGRGRVPRELLQAALLHDAGKTVAPLNMAERVLVVLAHKFMRGRARRWGQGEPRGWRRPFVTAAQHPEWGARLAAQGGAPPLAVELIRRHQACLTRPFSPEEELLLQLQMADDES